MDDREPDSVAAGRKPPAQPGRYVYDDFTLTFNATGSGMYEVVARANERAETRSTFKMPMTAADLEAAVLALGSTRSRDVGSGNQAAVKANAEQLGAALSAALFDTTIGPAFEAARAAAEAAGRGLRLTMSLVSAPELLSVPWELLYLKRTFLASQRRTPIVRCLDTGQRPTPQRIEGAVRVLGVVASPSDLPSLDVEEERRRVEVALSSMIERGLVTLDWCDPATPRRLREQLRDGSYHVLHYIGHSDFTEQAGGALFLETDDGRQAPVNDAVLTNLLGDQTSLRLAVLNSCEGARTTLTDPYAGIATSLVAIGVPAVIAMQFPISDRAAIAFADELFTSLIGRQFPIDAAVSEARKAVFTEVNEIEWATPVLFLRTTDSQLFDFADAPISGLPAQKTPPLTLTRAARHRRPPMVVGAAVTTVAALAITAAVLWPDNSHEGRAPDTTASDGALDPRCNGMPLPAPPPSVTLATEAAASLQAVQRWADLVASAQPGKPDTALFNEVKAVYPGFNVSSPDTLSKGYGNLERSYVSWVEDGASGSIVVAQVVYDNAGGRPCRTGFICRDVTVTQGVIASMRSLSPVDGTFDGFGSVSLKAPYIEGTWIASDARTNSGPTVHDRLLDICSTAQPN